ncbi:hypothetical protein [Streptomyces sp. S.PB5]|uniref:Acg family FMN-binding oxidoreductase n=1 Tax=Streptomyces sp. S.PB5 TaxID=3020844 RepID=UPI0025AF5777|nr:hypothetical protein [Streptomyces sp. S.PB5]MDN3027824.1 hypothetical protein [Streptomyces sp. S.PB5]
MSLTYESPGRAALHLARAASLAPSPHNSQPWSFVEEGHDHAFEVHLDAGRRLILTDPGGREAHIACGAALFNVRLAVRRLGFRPAVDLLPEPGRPGYLAHVGYAEHLPADPEEALLARAMPHRHTHRGHFGPDPVPAPLLDELREQALTEGAVLQVVDEPENLRLLTHLVRTAEAIHRADPGHRAELRRYVGPQGIPPRICPRHPDGTLLAGRDYLGLSWCHIRRPQRWSPRTGTVAVLSSRYDTREEWLRSGQALQRVLLHAAAQDVMAAFHTQPLELPAPRAELRAHLTGGLFPQVVLRLGRTTELWHTPRRPPTEVLDRWRP